MSTQPPQDRYESLLRRCEALEPVSTVVVYPCEATALAGFAVEEARRFFGQPRGLKPSLVAKLSRLEPLPTAASEARYLERFQELQP